MAKNSNRTMIVPGALAVVVVVYFFEVLPSQLPNPVGTYQGNTVFVTTYPNRICLSSGTNQNCGAIPINGDATALSLSVDDVSVLQIKIMPDGSYQTVMSYLDK